MNLDPTSDPRTVADRRHAPQLGPPSGQEERRGRPRRATDALKMSCPFCGSSESAVVRSRGTVTVDQVRRRRQCAECGRRFPTSETVDVASLQRELGENVEAVRATLTRPENQN